MSLEKTSVIDLLEITQHGFVQVRTKVSILESGKEISGTYHRHAIAPGANYSGEDAKVQAICAVVHTPDVVAKYRAQQIEFAKTGSKA